MPRRPRPAARVSTPKTKSTPSVEEKAPKVRPNAEPELDAGSDEEPEEFEEFDDVDAPRIAQWTDDDEIEQHGSSDHESNSVDALPGPSKLKALESDLSSLPMGALLKAQRALASATAVNDSDDSDGSSSDSDAEGPAEQSTSDPKGKKKEEWSLRPRPDISKRSNKHAPVEVTSKRPVTRKRFVGVGEGTSTIQPRDPRFLPMVGEFSEEKFKGNYGFLADAHSTELKALRDNLKRARKLLSNAPRETRHEQEREVNRLELAVKRAESTVNKDRRDKVDHEALHQVKKEEREKQKDGKGGWWMKESDKKDLLVRARYNALAEQGGQHAVKKAIAKKQKKIEQKEKKSRPDGGPAKRRMPISDGGWESRKRRKVV